jgi:hypothetical protein
MYSAPMRVKVWEALQRQIPRKKEIIVMMKKMRKGKPEWQKKDNKKNMHMMRMSQNYIC